jgi:hypothetical protein
MFTSVLKDNKLLRSHKVEIKVFLKFLACGWEDPDPEP